MANRERTVLRCCAACRRLADRRHLWRIIRPAGGGRVQLDQGMGRSAYLCPTETCLAEARRRKRLQRALRCPVDDVLYQQLEQRLAGATTASVEAR